MKFEDNFFNLEEEKGNLRKIIFNESNLIKVYEWDSKTNFLKITKLVKIKSA